ncbi:MAG TPA: homoserine O-acetyltransferase [Cyclobacteriaceae bacterium]|nr:homoserine O-acetyltransferase [Cyclobacteriaceae bacterium]
MKVQQHTFHYNQNFNLEAGGSLPGFRLQYSTLGKLNEDKSNVVWVCHALTGSSDFLDWWGELFSDQGVFSPEEYFIICANTLGSCYGSTGPLEINSSTDQPYFHDFPLLTNHDAVRAFDLLRQHLEFEKIHTLIGGSLGGQQALEWAVYNPAAFQFLIPVACNAKHSSWGIAINESQRMAIEADATWKNRDADAGAAGLAAARATAMVSFRSYDAYKSQDDEDLQRLDHYSASSYQQYQGEKLVNRFNAFSFWTLSKMMDNHNVGRNRNGIEAALARIQSATLVIGIDSDVLFPISEQQVISRLIPGSQLEIVTSPFGHDGFLIETKKLNVIIREFLIEQSKYILQ